MTDTSDSVLPLPLRRRVLAPLPLLAAATLATACGGHGSPASPATPRSTAQATSDSTPRDDASPTPAAADISAGNVVFSSTLKTPTQDFGVSSQNVSEDADGITLTVPHASGGYTFSTPVDFHGIPQSMAIRVHIDEPQQSGVYAGIACRGMSDSNTYLMVVDAKGDYAIVRVKDNNQTVLDKGTAAFDVSWPITLDAACVTPSSSDTTNRLVLVANGTRLASVDDSYDQVPISNSFALFAISPAPDTGTGSVLFHDLSVRSASSQ